MTDKKVKEKKSITMGIKLKLIIGFVIPLICIIVVGVGAYSMAASGMSANYEDSMSKALIMAMGYLDFGFESSVSESEQLYYDTDLMRWATGAIYNDWTKKSVEEKAVLNLNLKGKGNEFVAAMYIIPGKDLPMVSTQEISANIPGFYNELKNSSEGECLQHLKGGWVGSHNYIDGVLAKYDSSYSAESYACSYIRPMTTKRACIVVDYSSDAIAGVLRDLDLGEKGISAFVTEDGREILLRGNEIVKDDSFSFTDQEFYAEAMNDNAATIIDYVQYKKEDYLFMMTKSHKNGSAICAMVPMSMVNAGANSIKAISVVMVVISCVIAVVVCLLIIAGIAATINQISSKLKSVSGGDLSVEINTNRSDEFKVLVKSIAEMIRNSRDLIEQVLKTTKNVSVSTSKMADASDALSESNNQIAKAVEEMDNGINQQSVDVQNCLTLMNELSQRIGGAVDTVQHMNYITEDTKNVIASGMKTVDDLSSKSEDTTNITRNVSGNIRNLEQSISEIEKFMGMINNIAEETSLLALNASIEAARAGEAGKGFAVVAQSVGKLSEGTIDASNQISNVMEQIRSCTIETMEVATQAEKIVSEQSDTVENTIQVFNNMNENLERLVEKIEMLERNIESMEDQRNGTLSAIESISAVAEETAASVSVVNDSLKNQMEMVDNLHHSAIELEERAGELTDAVNAFTI